jgi:tellurite resistance protein
MIGRLFGRVPRSTAFVEVRNILATTPFEQVCGRDIAGALVKAKLHCRDATKELTGIFEHAALLAAVDRELSDSDRRGLAALQRAFELTDAEAASAIESAVGQVFEWVMREALSDGTFTEQEKAGLEATSKALGMSDAQTERLYKTAALAAVNAAFSGAIADRRYTKDEEAHVTALAESLGVTIKQDESTAALVARFRLMGQIEDGVFPSIDVPILLHRGEVCHFLAVAAHHEIKTVTKRINYSGPTASIKIMKGVRWRAGSIAIEKVTADVMIQLDTGILYITSKRVFFDGTKKNVSIPLGKITNFTVFKDGLQIEKEAGNDLYFLGASDWELAGACLDGAARMLR